MKKILLVLASIMSLVLLASCKNDVQDVYITNYDDVSDSYSGTYYGMVTITSTDGRIRSSEKIFATLSIANAAKNKDDFSIEFPYEYKFSWAAGGTDAWTSYVGKKSFVKIGNTYYDTVSLDNPFQISGNPYGSSFSFTYPVYHKGLPNITYEEYCNMMYTSDYYKAYYNAYQQYLQNLTYEEYCRVMGYDYDYYKAYYNLYQSQTYEEYCSVLGYDYNSNDYYYQYQNRTYSEYCNMMGYDYNSYSYDYYNDYQQYLQNFTYREYCNMMGYDYNSYNSEYSQTWFSDYQQYLEKNVDTIDTEVTVTFKKP